MKIDAPSTEKYRRAGVLAFVATVFTLFAGSVLVPTSANSADLGNADALRNLCVSRLDDPRPLTTRQRNWLRDCRDVFAPEAPTPSASATSSGSPSASPTTSPSASPSPTVSPTTSPTASPSPSPTPTPTPSPTASPGLNCMSQPSRCGYPDETNTGVRPGSTLTLRGGDQHFNAPGVYENMDITGCVYVEAHNVTIRNSRIRGDCWFAIRTAGISGATWTNLNVEDTEVVLSAVKEGAYGICCSNYTLTRVWLHGAPLGNAGADCVYFANNVLVRDTFCQVGILPGSPPGNPNATTAHSDGMTTDGGRDVVLDHNTIRNPNMQTSAILISTNSGTAANTTIRNGLYAGGGYTVYCGTDAGGVDLPMIFTNNRIARDWNGGAPGYFATGGFFGPVTHCADAGVVRSGNVWDDTGLPVPNAAPAAAPVGIRAFK